ncbi:MAG: hypothetical protein YK1309IOTA_1090009 [Marine Group I thaumarchaeote]|nr:MAG: hypothetical protein YK1309IOTA_1090009 [Marine Group I thaumarchaeote]
MRKKFEVFISSKQDEFKRKRKEVAKLINNHRYLEATPLEQRGAVAEDPSNASVKAVRKSGIYLGIFGEKYSEITAREYREAVKKRIPCLVYIKKTKQIEQKLLEFLKDEVKSNFKYYEFSTNKKLLKQIEDDLDEFIFELLENGLEQYKKRKKKVIQTSEETSKKVNKIVKKKEVASQLEDFFNKYYTKQDYIRFALGISSSIETLAKVSLEKLGYRGTELKKPLGWILHRLLTTRLINESDIEKINQIQYIRNDVVHRGRTVSKSDAIAISLLAKEIIKKLSYIKSQPKLSPAGLVLNTNKSSYRDNEIIKIFGGVQIMLSGVPISILIINPRGKVIAIEQVGLMGDGTFETKIKAGGLLWKPGEKYVIKATYGHEKNTVETSIKYEK